MSNTRNSNPALEDALRQVRNTAPMTDYLTCLETLKTLLYNIQSNPQEPSYRNFRANEPWFFWKAGRLKGIDPLMAALGFANTVAPVSANPSNVALYVMAQPPVPNTPAGNRLRTNLEILQKAAQTPQTYPSAVSTTPVNVYQRPTGRNAKTAAPQESAPRLNTGSSNPSANSVRDRAQKLASAQNQQQQQQPPPRRSPTSASSGERSGRSERTQGSRGGSGTLEQAGDAVLERTDKRRTPGRSKSKENQPLPTPQDSSEPTNQRAPGRTKSKENLPVPPTADPNQRSAPGRSKSRDDLPPLQSEAQPAPKRGTPGRSKSADDLPPYASGENDSKRSRQGSNRRSRSTDQLPSFHSEQEDDNKNDSKQRPTRKGRRPDNSRSMDVLPELPETRKDLDNRKDSSSRRSRSLDSLPSPGNEDAIIPRRTRRTKPRGISNESGHSNTDYMDPSSNTFGFSNHSTESNLSRKKPSRTRSVDGSRSVDSTGGGKEKSSSRQRLKPHVSNDDSDLLRMMASTVSRDRYATAPDDHHGLKGGSTHTGNVASLRASTIKKVKRKRKSNDGMVTAYTRGGNSTIFGASVAGSNLTSTVDGVPSSASNLDGTIETFEMDPMMTEQDDLEQQRRQQRVTVERLERSRSRRGGLRLKSDSRRNVKKRGRHPRFTFLFVMTSLFIMGELTLDLAQTIISLASLNRSVECCGAVVDSGGRTRSIAFPYMILLFFEFGVLFFSILQARGFGVKHVDDALQQSADNKDSATANIAQVISQNPNYKLETVGLTKRLCCGRSFSEVLSYVILINPFLWCLLTWTLLFEFSSLTEIFVLMGLELVSLTFSFSSVYLQRRQMTRKRLILSGISVLPFFVACALVYYYLDKGGVCYREEGFFFTGCDVCPNGQPPSRDIFEQEGTVCAGGGSTRKDSYCGVDENDSFCYFEYE